MDRDQFRLDLECTHCGMQGLVTWEENSFVNPQGAQRRLVDVRGGFHAELGRTSSGDPLIICDSCDTIQTD